MLSTASAGWVAAETAVRSGRYTMRRSVSRHPGKLAILATFLAIIPLVGCAAIIPDMGPFAAQTERMSSGVKNGYTQARTLLSQADLENEWLDSLDTAWRQTVRTLNALTAYSGALADLARTGTEGREAAARITGGLESVTSTLQVPGIPANIVGAIGALNDYIARIRARGKLREILGEAQPAIDTIAWVIRQNLGALERVNELAGRQIRLAYAEDHQVIANYYEGLVREDRRILTILTIFLERRAALHSGETAVAEARLQELLDRDPILGQAVMGLRADDPEAWQTRLEPLIEERHAQLAGRSRATHSEAGRYRPDYETYVGRMAEIEGLRMNGSEILRKSATAVRAWARAHAKLLESLEEEWSFVHLAEFTAAVQDVLDAYRGE
jgi:hypothetical protein